jgi:hypothetical protein
MNGATGNMLELPTPNPNDRAQLMRPSSRANSHMSSCSNRVVDLIKHMAGVKANLN